MLAVRLPEVGATRDAASQMLDAQLPDRSEVQGQVVVLLARDLSASSESFADQVVKHVLQDLDASSIVLVSPPSKFDRNIQESAARRRVEERISHNTAASLGV